MRPNARMATDVPGITHLTGLNLSFLSHRMTGNTIETMISCPISIPILKDNSEVANWLPYNCGGNRYYRNV